MKRVIASTEMHTYRVYFKDGNQKLFDAPHFAALIRHLANDLSDNYSVMDIYKIEEVE